MHVHALWSQAADHPFAAVAEEGKTLSAALVSLEAWLIYISSNRRGFDHLEVD